MRRVLSACLIAALLASAACEHRAPLTAGQVVGVADHFQLRENLSWGEPLEVLPPGDPDSNGRSWWQLRYAPGRDGAARIVVVDDESGWARRPPPGYVVHVPPLAKPGAASPVAVAAGHFVLALTPAEIPDEARRTALEREVVRLNALAGEGGLMPLFSLRRSRDERCSIVYGWQGDQGIAKDDRVVEWLAVRTPYRGCTWVDLSQP